jgi:hypothetical protein
MSEGWNIDRARVLRRMEVMDIDRILSDSQDWSKIALACKRTSVLYESKCASCNPEQPRAESSRQEEKGEHRVRIYYGESSRSLYEGSREHIRDAEKFQEGSHIGKHW